MNFSEKIIEASYMKVFLFGLVFAALYYLVGYDSGDSHIKSASQSRQKVRDVKAEMIRVQKSLDRSRDFKEKLKIKDEQFLTFTSFIPEQLNISDMMKAISAEAKAAGVNINAISDGAVGKNEKFQYTSPIAVSVQLDGGFPQHLLFLSFLTRLDSIFTVSQMSFAIKGKGRGDPSAAQVSFNANIVGYRYIGTGDEGSGQ